MLRNAIRSFRISNGKRHISDSNVKLYTFLAAPDKKFSNIKEQKLPPIDIDEDTALQLEKISLVGIHNEKIIQILQEAIRFADQILVVDTINVQPLVTVLENESLYLREDVPKLDLSKSELISHSELTQENYFVTPVGNLEYIPEQKTFKLPSSKEVCKN